MQIDGVGLNLILTLISEVGLDLAQFPSAKHFVSWLGLAPNRRITGGKVLSSKTRKNKARLATAFRQTANAAGNQKDTAMSYAFRSLALRKGRTVAITATARKIATIVYNMLVHKQAYEPLGSQHYQELIRNKKIKNIQRTIQKEQIKANELAFS